MAGSISFEDFTKELQQFDLVILGEIHGTKEIPHQVKRIINIIKPDTVFLELPQLSTRNMQKFFKENQDGRASREYFYLIEFLKKRKIETQYLELFSSSDKDRDMFDCLIKNHKTRSVIVCGNIHASYGSNLFKNKITLGRYIQLKFRTKAVNVNILPVSGTYHNFGIKKILHKEHPPGIYKNMEQDFDYTYLIDKVTPCSFIK